EVSCEGVDADLPDSELQRLFLTPHNPMLSGVRRIKDTTTVILLFNGLKVPNYVRCGNPVTTKQQQTKPTPKQPAQTQPSTSKSTTQPTWADRVANQAAEKSAQSVNRHPPPPPYPPYPLHPLHPLQIQLLPMQQPRVAPRNAGQLKP
ncbi:hypothetical protein MTO96_046569, partial [Rhipicephalus appendiculatus]